MNRRPKGLFGNWLENKIQKTTMTLTDFGEQIGLAPGSIRQHIQMQMIPHRTTLKLYSEYFNTRFKTVEKMLRIDYLGDDIAEEIPDGTFYRWLRAKIGGNTMVVYQLSKALHVSRPSVYYQMRSKTDPSYPLIKRYYDYFKSLEDTSI